MPPRVETTQIKNKYYFEGHAESVWSTIEESVTMPKEAKIFFRALLKQHRNLGRNVVIWFTWYESGNFDVVCEGYRSPGFSELVWQHRENGHIYEDRS